MISMSCIDFYDKFRHNFEWNDWKYVNFRMMFDKFDLISQALILFINRNDLIFMRRNYFKSILNILKSKNVWYYKITKLVTGLDKLKKILNIVNRKLATFGDWQIWCFCKMLAGMWNFLPNLVSFAIKIFQI